jgi:chemotaxis protein CheD
MVVTSQVLVAMAEFRTAAAPARLICPGLGSGVGVCAYDRDSKLGAVAHFVLPASRDQFRAERPARFVTTGLEALLEELVDTGCDPARLVIAYAGGAQAMSAGDRPQIVDLGTRNVAALKETLAKLGLEAVAHEVGGTHGRSLSLCASSGEMRVRSVVGTERILHKGIV